MFPQINDILDMNIFYKYMYFLFCAGYLDPNVMKDYNTNTRLSKAAVTETDRSGGPNARELFVVPV